MISYELEIKSIFDKLKVGPISELDKESFMMELGQYAKEIGKNLYLYANKTFLSDNQMNELHSLSQQFAFIRTILDLHLRDEFLKKHHEIKIEQFIDSSTQNPINFFYVIKGYPSYFIISYTKNNKEQTLSIKAEGFPAIFLDVIGLPDDQNTWLNICFYSSSEKKKILTDSYIQQILKNI